jgi:hypothetical protein
VLSLPRAENLAVRIRDLFGAEHLARLMEMEPAQGEGFRLGGFGMGDAATPPNFGVNLLDTFEGRAQLWYFPIADQSTADNGAAAWSALMECVTAKGGLHQCTHLATPYLNQSL